MQLILPVGVNEMDFLINDLSLHGQFQDLSEFENAIGLVMRMRDTARQFERELYCHVDISNSEVSPSLSMRQAIPRALSRDQRQKVLSWLCNTGPFWDDPSGRGADDWLECKSEIVTEHAIGEAAYRCAHGEEHHLVSFAKSKWQGEPVITVHWCLNDADTKKIDVCNHWEQHTLENSLQNAPIKYKTWSQFGAAAMARFANLRFSKDCFSYLKGCPFSRGAAVAINKRLHALDRYQSGVDANGRRNAESQEIYQNHFTGDKGWFSDSSDFEKENFRKELTFKHPEKPNKLLECYWHGKISAQTLRIHFSWPNPPGMPLYVVYVGPKLTKR